MKDGRDFAIVYHINEHFADLQEDIEGIESFDAFASSKEKRRAILFSFLQIGELANQLSKSFLEDYGNPNIKYAIAIRNRIVHGYSTVRDDIVFPTVKQQLPSLIEDLNIFARKRYKEMLNDLIGHEVQVLFNAPALPASSEFQVGYIEEITTLNGRFQDALFFCEQPFVEITSGMVTDVLTRDNCLNDWLLVVGTGVSLDKENLGRISSSARAFLVLQNN